MHKGRQIAQGKTKVLYEQAGQPDVLVVQQMDAISAGDGARRHEIAGKGRIAAKTTARVFRLLNLCGLPTHYLSGGEDDDDNEMLVRRCNMIPLEVVVRGVAAGSLVKRRPGIPRGSIIVPRMIEFFLKDDAAHDPLIEPDQIVAQGIANTGELAMMSEIARITYEILAHAWRRHQTLLVDLKIEFGRLTSGEGKGNLIVADVIDNDSWRIWPQGREELMLDKQVYRNLPEVTGSDLDRVKANYELVATQAGEFTQMKPGMVALFADGGAHEERLATLARALNGAGLPSLRHITAPDKTPGYVLQLVQQLDATFGRLVYITLGASAALFAMVNAATSNVVLAAGEDDEATVLACAKPLAIDDTVLFGRVLLAQANARSAVLQADAVLNQPSGGASHTLA